VSGSVVSQRFFKKKKDRSVKTRVYVGVWGQ